MIRASAGGGPHAGAAAAEAQAGGFSEEVQEATINVFGPETIDIAAGEAVTWTIVGLHTIAFNPPASAPPWLTRMPTGTWSSTTKK